MYLMICLYVGSGTLSQSFLTAFLSLFIIPVYMYFCHKITITSRTGIPFCFRLWSWSFSRLERFAAMCKHAFQSSMCCPEYSQWHLEKPIGSGRRIHRTAQVFYKSFPCLIRSPIFSSVAQLPRSLLLAVDIGHFLAIRWYKKSEIGGM